MPILLMWFGYGVPMSIQDMIQIALFPALMALMKLDTILEEIIRSRTAAATVKVQEETATRCCNVTGPYHKLSHFEIDTTTSRWICFPVHMVVLGCKFWFGLMFQLIRWYNWWHIINTTCEPYVLILLVK